MCFALPRRQSTFVQVTLFAMVVNLGVPALAGIAPCNQVAMFVNVSPVLWNMQETVCSLKFASRCRKVQLGKTKKSTEGSSGSGAGGGTSAPTHAVEEE